MKRNEIDNATKAMIIDVPEQLTHSSRQRNPNNCVFAKACRNIPDVEEAIVHISTAYLKFKGEETFRRYRVNTRLRDQIVAFDRFGVFDPGEYTISVIQPSHRADGRRQGGKKGRTPTRSKESYKRKVVQIKGVRARANIASL
jgi:hypothetical protein